MNPPHPAIAVIEKQLTQLDAIYAEAAETLNSALGTDRVRRWKAQTEPILAQVLGPEEAKLFAAKKPGPSFTPDYLEELSDEVEVYRTHLTTLVSKLKKSHG
jgi:hypothetical protein